jgi:hypothetical protein
MFALLTLPRGIPIDPETPVSPDEREAPVGIIIRPGPAVSPRRMNANEADRRPAR